MFSEYEDTLNQFIKVLGKSNPDEFTQREWDLIWDVAIWHTSLSDTEMIAAANNI